MLLLVLRFVTVLSILVLITACVIPASVGIGLHIAPEAVRGRLNPTELDQFRLSGLEIALLIATAVLFLISAIRLIRRTQSFLAYALGFVAIVIFTVLNGYLNAKAKAPAGAEIAAIPGQVAQELSAGPAALGMLGLALFVGVVTLFIDRADKAHWRHVGRDG